MNVRIEGGWDHPGLPSLRHWLIAGASLFVLTLTIPFIAGFV